MDNINFQDNMELRVFLLSIYKRKDNESIKDIMNIMINAGLFDMKNAKKCLKDLRKLEYVIDDSLSMSGISKAKEVELEFKV